MTFSQVAQGGICVRDAGGHRHQLPQRDLADVTTHRFPMLGQQRAQRLFKVGDQTVRDGDPNEGGEHALGHRPDMLVIIAGEPVPIVGDLGLVIDVDQHRSYVVQRRRASCDRPFHRHLQRGVVDRRPARRGRWLGRRRRTSQHRPQYGDHDQHPTRASPVHDRLAHRPTAGRMTSLDRKDMPEPRSVLRKLARSLHRLDPVTQGARFAAEFCQVGGCACAAATPDRRSDRCGVAICRARARWLCCAAGYLPPR